VEVLRLLAQGRSNNQISQELVVADGTTRRHVANIYEKIGVANCTEATRYALREGLLSLDESPPSDPAT
jgi:DNA-binding NarL/FixJ family response regulator